MSLGVDVHVTFFWVGFYYHTLMGHERMAREVLAQEQAG